MAAASDSCSNGSSDIPWTGSSKDAALVFLADRGFDTCAPVATELELRRLRWKADLLILPQTVLSYTLNTLDKVLLNYSAVMGIKQDLHLSGNQFSTAASSFWIAVAIAAPFSTIALQKVPTGKWIGFVLTFWGISTACHSVIQGYTSLVAVRVASGLFEASLVPAIMLLTSQYYTRQEQTARFAFWYSGLGLGQIVGGLLSYAFQHVSNTAPLASWRIMFLAVGCFTIFVGIAVCFLLPDTLMQARFLSEKDKVQLLEHIKSNQTGIVDRCWETKQILEALSDPQYWLMFSAILLQGTGGVIISTYSATLLHTFGFSASHAALLITPMGLVNILSIAYVGVGARHTLNKRWLFTLSAMAIGLVGVAVMTFAPADHRPALLVGLFLANFFTGCTPLTFQWFTANTAGHTKRAFIAASTNAAFALGNIVGPLTFKAGDAPGYHAAKLDLLAMWAASMACLALVTGYYRWANARKDVKEKADEVKTEVAFAGLTDRQNGGFRYVI